jgi:hypothetical protein
VVVTYYPIPDIPDGVTPSERRFCEQVRSTIAKLDAYGQPLEVHQPYYTESSFAGVGTPLPEFVVYRADRNVELLYATWSPNFDGTVEHDLALYYRESGIATRVKVQEIAAASVATTAWQQFIAKRFTQTGSSHTLRSGEMLTLEIIDAIPGPSMPIPLGLLSLYFRGATS